MTEEVFDAFAKAREQHLPCVLVTVAATKGSVPRAAGAKMLVYEDGRAVGTIGGGKMEALAIADSMVALQSQIPLLKLYPLHESDAASFGAICGGEVTLLIEPQTTGEALFIVGGGHCGKAISKLARECGFLVTVIDDRAELLVDFPAAHRISDRPAPEFIAGREWQKKDALVIVSRNFELDREALAAALQRGTMGYLGMIGSRRKVRLVFDDLASRGANEAQLRSVFAPIGLDIGADSPAEVAISVMAEVLQTLRGRKGGHLAFGHG